MKPAASAPRNPDFPPAAIIPPTKPSASPGLSAIASAMKPARTGSISPKATPPIPLKNAAAGVIVPKFCRSAADKRLMSTHCPSIRKAIAIRIPPPTTNGSICDTPFISCIYILWAKLSFFPLLCTVSSEWVPALNTGASCLSALSMSSSALLIPSET